MFIKRILCVILLCVVLVMPCAARVTTVVVGGGVATTASTTWIYSDGGTGTTTGHEARFNTYCNCGVFTPGAHTFTKVGFKLTATGAGTTECKVSLYAGNTSSSALYASATIATPAIGWNDGTISYTTSAATEYYVCFECNSTTYDVDFGAGDYGKFGEIAYTSFPSNPLATSLDNNKNWLVRLGY
jgi:hypothetical protein